MAEGLLALNADGKRRLQPDGKRVLTTDASTSCCCRCAPCAFSGNTIRAELAGITNGGCVTYPHTFGDWVEFRNMVGSADGVYDLARRDGNEFFGEGPCVWEQIVSGSGLSIDVHLGTNTTCAGTNAYLETLTTLTVWAIGSGGVAEPRIFGRLGPEPGSPYGWACWIFRSDLPSPAFCAAGGLPQTVGTSVGVGDLGVAVDFDGIIRPVAYGGTVDLWVP